LTPAWAAGSGTRLAGVIGWPVRHSLSPVIHNAGFRELGLDWTYLAFEVAPGAAVGAVDAMRVLGMVGLNVTRPHKDAVAAAVDRLTEVAEALGAVNTVVPDGRELVGDSTDGAGLLAGLATEHGFDPAGRRCLVLGAGGAGRAVVLALAGAGAADVGVVTRRSEQARTAVALAPAVGRVATAADVAAADLVVNATPVADRLPLGLDAADLGTGQLVVDLLYEPPVSALLAAARARGATTANGVGMLIHQAALSFEAWTGAHPPLAAMQRAVADHLLEHASR
jgi:shikimate dehydrogenase